MNRIVGFILACILTAGAAAQQALTYAAKYIDMTCLNKALGKH